MSHVINNNPYAPIPVSTTIVNYAVGGEAYSASEFSISRVTGIIFGQVSPTNNSLGVVLFPILVGGFVKLFQFVGGSPVEIPTTTALNAVLVAMIFYQ